MAKIYISVGTNIDRSFHIRAAVNALGQHFDSLELSSVYESESVGFNGSAFYNMVIGAQTDLAIADCVALFKRIEDSFGRDRSAAKFSGRTLDLDLLLYDDAVCDKPVILPREEINENAFVLWPLAQIAPDVEHPILCQTYAELWQQYNKQQKLWPVPFNWSV